jgi:hypothetical protein
MAQEGSIRIADVPTGRKLASPNRNRPAWEMGVLRDATPTLVAVVSERLEEIDAERFGDQQGMTLTDTETGTEYAIYRGYLEPHDPPAVVTHFTIRDQLIVPLKLKDAVEPIMSQKMGTMWGRQVTS